MIRLIDAYLCSSETCAAMGLDLVRTCSHHGILLRVWPGQWLKPLGADVPPEMADTVLEHAGRLAMAAWDGSFPALLLPDGRAGGGEIWPGICRELNRKDAKDAKTDAKIAAPFAASAASAASAVKAPVKP